MMQTSLEMFGPYCFSACLRGAAAAVSASSRRGRLPLSALLVHSASPHLAKRVSPADYLAVWCVDTAGLCFPRNTKSWKIPYNNGVSSGKCNTKRDVNAKFSARQFFDGDSVFAWC